jgi:hypothetical protein
MDRFVDYMTTKRGMAEALRAVVASGGNPFAHSRDRMVEALGVLLRAGAEAGTLRPDADAADLLAGLSGVSLAAGEPAQRPQAGRLLDLLVEHEDSPAEPIPVAIETPRGLLVACLRGTGRPVYAINPLAVARYRERQSVARAKSDRADAALLANILRTDRAAHRPLPADSELVQAIAVLARAQQDVVWTRQQITNQLRSLLPWPTPMRVRSWPPPRRRRRRLG